jgi:cytidylate kinase
MSNLSSIEGRYGLHFGRRTEVIPNSSFPCRNPKYRHMRHVIIAGLTASGKTTQAKRLAQILGLRYVSGAAIRAELLGISEEVHADSQFWLDRDRGGAIDRARLLRDDPRDKNVENELIAIAKGSEGCVFDTWVMPWLFNEQCLCVYLRSPQRTRAYRLLKYSQSSSSLEEVVKELKQKDELARKFFLEAYRVDIEFDMSPFDIIIDSKESAIDASAQISVVSHYLATMSQLALAGDAVELKRVRLPASNREEQGVKLWIDMALFRHVTGQ